MFLAPKIFFGKHPKISNRDYKIEHTSEHRAKFRGDRPTELGDYAREKIRNLGQSQTWVRPALQVRLGGQFRGLTFLS